MPRLTHRAEKDLAQLPEPLRRKAQAIIARLDEELVLGKKLLADLKGLRSARLGRSHRIIYEVKGDGVTVLTVSLRRDAYR